MRVRVRVRVRVRIRVRVRVTLPTIAPRPTEHSSARVE